MTLLRRRDSGAGEIAPALLPVVDVPARHGAPVEVRKRGAAFGAVSVGTKFLAEPRCALDGGRLGKFSVTAFDRTCSHSGDRKPRGCQ